jgi:cyclophilin family peptidyl-prolyl cis-trans isomerase
MRKYAQRGLDYESIVTEIKEQRPFNTGSTEARHIRNRSHPLFTIEMAVNSLSGLPNTFTSRISDFATEFEVEYTVLGAVDDGMDTTEAIQERVHSNVRALSNDQMDSVERALERLVDKQILKRDETTVRLR